MAVETLIGHQATIDKPTGRAVMPPLSTIQLILEGVGAGLAMVGVGGSLATTVAVLLNQPSEKVSHWGHIGTALGFLVGIPAAIVTFALLSN